MTKLQKQAVNTKLHQIEKKYNIDVISKLHQIEKKHNIEVIYCSQVGSKLFGTDHANSDNDFRFLFLPKKEDLLLQVNLDHIKIGNSTKVKNTKDDIDFDGWSLQKWFKLIKKGETNAINLLFSMFSEKTIICENTNFTSIIKRDYKKLLNKNMKSFMGYALSQTKRFGIKGVRYSELDSFVKYIESIAKNENIQLNDLSELFEKMETNIKENKYTYINFVKAPGPRGAGDYKNITYISILGKLFEGKIKIGDFLKRIQTQFNQFGNRTKIVASTKSKTDFKALSHSYLISSEVLELVKTQFIKYPLTQAKFILDIKKGKVNVNDVVLSIENLLNDVDLELLKSNLQDESDTKFMNSIILNMYK